LTERARDRAQSLAEKGIAFWLAEVWDRVRVCLTFGNKQPFLRKWLTGHYFIGEKSVGCMYVESTFSTSLSACSDFTIS